MEHPFLDSRANLNFPSMEAWDDRTIRRVLRAFFANGSVRLFPKRRSGVPGQRSTQSSTQSSSMVFSDWTSPFFAGEFPRLRFRRFASTSERFATPGTSGLFASWSCESPSRLCQRAGQSKRSFTGFVGIAIVAKNFVSSDGKRHRSTSGSQTYSSKHIDCKF